MSGLAFTIAVGGALAVVALCCALRDLRDSGAPTGETGAGRRTRSRARPARPVLGWLPGLLRRHGGQLVARAMPPSLRRHLQRQIDAAGRPDGLTVDSYAQRKAVHLILFGGTGLTVAAAGGWLAALPLLAFGLIAQDIRLARLARMRTDRIDQSLPDFLDVLAVVVTAGLAFRAALGRVATMLGGPLGDEFAAVLREMDLGTSRRDAFAALRDRTGSARLGQVIAAVLQSEELGVPLAESLTEIASDQRRESAQSARRRASQATPRVSLVVSLILVPGTMILLAAVFYYGSSLYGHSLFPS